MSTRIYPTNRRRLPGREAYVITALRRKLAELKGLAAKGDNQAPEAIEHVTATLLLFKPDEDVSAVPAIRPYKADRQRWVATAFNVLRKEARPMTGRQIAYRVMEANAGYRPCLGAWKATAWCAWGVGGRSGGCWMIGRIAVH